MLENFRLVRRLNVFTIPYKNLGLVVFRKSSWALPVLYLKQRPQKFIFCFLHRGDLLSFTQFRTVYFTYMHLCSHFFNMVSLRREVPMQLFWNHCVPPPPQGSKNYCKNVHFAPLKWNYSYFTVLTLDLSLLKHTFFFRKKI